MAESPLDELAAAARQTMSTEIREHVAYTRRANIYDARQTPWVSIGLMFGMGFGLASLFWSFVAYWMFYFLVKAHLTSLM